MTENTSLDILKQAIMLEKRGKAFYSKVAEQAADASVKKLFSAMAGEEEMHARVLAEQYKASADGKPFSPPSIDDGGQSAAASAVLSDEIKKNIEAAEFEAAAISASIAMEEQAVKLYSERAKATDDPEEKALYSWLADWERDHLNMLLSIDRHLLEAVWNDNNYWPF